MSQIGDLSDGEFEMAIAAAAFAITSLEEEEEDDGDEEEDLMNQKRTVKGSSPTTTESHHRQDSMIKLTDLAKKAAAADRQIPKDSTANHNMTEKAMSAMPTANMHLNDAGIERFGGGKEMRRDYSKAQSPENPTILSSSKKNRGMNSVEEADEWEKEEMIKIKTRYEKNIATILEWENDKKTRAKRRMEQQERGVERRRGIALQEYHAEILWIDKFVSRTKALADEKKRNDESKARKKAKAMRSRGKNPRSCFCF